MKKLTGQATDAEIKGWKAKHTLGIYAVSVGGHIAYFKQPGFDELNFSFSKLDEEKVIDMWLALAASTKLGGSEEILTNPKLFAGAMQIIKKQSEGEYAELVKL